MSERRASVCRIVCRRFVLRVGSVCRCSFLPCVGAALQEGEGGKREGRKQGGSAGREGGREGGRQADRDKGKRSERKEEVPLLMRKYFDVCRTDCSKNSAPCVRQNSHRVSDKLLKKRLCIDTIVFSPTGTDQSFNKSCKFASSRATKSTHKQPKKALNPIILTRNDSLLLITHCNKFSVATL